MKDVPVIVSGTGPDDDTGRLKEFGVAAAFQPGVSTVQALELIQTAVSDPAH